MKLYLPALGILCSLGNNKQEVLANALRGSRDGLQRTPGLVLDQQPYFGCVRADLPPVEAPFERYDCRNNRLLLAAYHEIEDEVQALIHELGADRVAVVVGSSTSGIREVEDAFETQRKTGEYPAGYYDYKQEMGTVAEFLAGYLGLKNVAVTISTACSSSGKVFYSARNLIESGVCDAAIVGGADSLCRLTGNGFTALGAVSRTRSNPFSVHRDGINIGEGAALFILSKKRSAIVLKGVGESSDAYHISAPHPEGRGAEESMRNALWDAKLEPSEISYLNLHGTGTPHNDSTESAAVHRIFGPELPCSSTKALTGHTLGAAGAIETGLCWLTLSDLNQKRALLPHVWDGAPDDLVKPLNLVTLGATAENKTNHNFMSNSFAFGGSNVSLIIGTDKEA